MSNNPNFKDYISGSSEFGYLLRLCKIVRVSVSATALKESKKKPDTFMSEIRGVLRNHYDLLSEVIGNKDIWPFNTGILVIKDFNGVGFADQLEEFLKQHPDIVYFCQKFGNAVDADRAIIEFSNKMNLLTVQQEASKSIYRHGNSYKWDPVEHEHLRNKVADAKVHCLKLTVELEEIWSKYNQQ